MSCQLRTRSRKTLFRFGRSSDSLRVRLVCLPTATGGSGWAVRPYLLRLRLLELTAAGQFGICTRFPLGAGQGAVATKSVCKGTHKNSRRRPHLRQSYQQLHLFSCYRKRSCVIIPFRLSFRSRPVPFRPLRPTSKRPHLCLSPRQTQCLAAQKRREAKAADVILACERVAENAREGSLPRLSPGSALVPCRSVPSP